MALSGRLIQPAFPGGPALLATPAPLGRGHPHTKLAIRMVRQPDEHPVKVHQICARLGYEGTVPLPAAVW